MGKVRKMFVEFKSIFLTKNVLKENESHANVVVATTMLNIFLVCLLTYFLVSFNVFKVGMELMMKVLIANSILLVIPAILCFIIKGNNKWMRIFLFMFFTISMAYSDAILKYNVTLLMVLPIILAARYYNKKFTIWVSTFTIILFIISTSISVKYGQQDLNSYNLVIPKGTTITINSNLRDSITKLNVDEGQRLKNIYLHLFLPKLFVFSIISFACIQISQSGKKMLEKQIEITNKTSRLNTELDLAYSIQKNLLPSTFPAFPEKEDIDIYALSMPAKEVGGDFYDMFLIDKDHLALCIADVSGKGVPAALFMMVSKILIKVITDEGGEVDKVISRVNNILSNGNKLDLFVTAWFGVVDLRTGVVEYVNAGHNFPLIYSKIDNSFQYLKSKSNFVIAGMENTKYEKSEARLDPGDKLFLYTDGVVEATDINNKMYGEERLKQFLDQNSELNVKDTIISLKKELERYFRKTEQFDDITMLEFQYKGIEKVIKKNNKDFRTNVSELPNVQEFINNELTDCKIDKKTINEIELAVEEIFVNISKYAYLDREGFCSITVISTENSIELVFKDDGIKFNPLKKPKPDVTLPKEKRQIGGLGIYLAEKNMDNIEYTYNDNKNILKMTKIIRKEV